MRELVQISEDSIVSLKRQFEDEMKRREDKIKSETKPEDEKEKELIK